MSTEITLHVEEFTHSTSIQTHRLYAAFKLEQSIHQDTNATTAQDVLNPALVPGAAGLSSEAM